MVQKKYSPPTRQRIALRTPPLETTDLGKGGNISPDQLT